MEKIVTEELIAKWKEEFKSIYKTDTGIYFRPLSRKEYVSLVAKQQTDPAGFDHELETAISCTLGGTTEDELRTKSGIATVLSEQILQRSGFVQVDVEEV